MGLFTKKQFWKSQSFQIVMILTIILISLFLPKIPLLRGWEYKFSVQAVELGRSEIPRHAVRIKTPEDALALYPQAPPHLRNVLTLAGPLPIAAWSCMPLGQAGLCVRYLWKNNEPLTLVVSQAPKATKGSLNPFTKSGWGGYILVHDHLAYALTGPLDPDEILSLLSVPTHHGGQKPLSPSGTAP